MIDSFRKLLRKAAPGFPELYAPRLGEVVAISDPIPEEKASDRFRPRYAVDVLPLLPSGEADPDALILTGLPLPVTAAGDGRGIYGFPAIGARVLYAFAYGSPAHPMILAVYPQERAIPALQPGELLLQQQDGAYVCFDAKGNLHIQTHGEIRQDSQSLVIVADEACEEYGSLTRKVEGDASEETGGRLLQTVLGAWLLSVAGDSKAAILGAEERTIGGDKSELVGGKQEAVAQVGVTLKANLGDLLLESVAGNASLKAALYTAIESLTLSAGNATGVELLTILDAVLTALQAETHGTGVGPSTPPTNAADYAQQQTKLATLKG